ncbi:hypothetical protein AXF42_Ash008951 [Apostasia shenzhenica]|uniref:Altered inheritance of mitochondria protein 32 n=1 Tax=Apostasia shenzhenica TaxID=1088818 RepID=A0A2I0ASY9_9ASPA|nr:hypothetical protein AXF42_Ash008951 [Apostasia shenzhenica]
MPPPPVSAMATLAASSLCKSFPGHHTLRTLIFYIYSSHPPLSSPMSAAEACLCQASADCSEGTVNFSAESTASGVDGVATKEFGFRRAEFGRDSLVGTVQPYDRHLFLRYKSPDAWPSNFDTAVSNRLPHLFAAAIRSRKGDMKKRTRLMICGGEDGTSASDGDVLIFPDMICCRRLAEIDVHNFVEEVLVKDAQWLPGAVETLTGSYVFVCSHGSRDRRCGVCGPILIEKFREKISSSGLNDQVFVYPCSHIGGHKFAGNVIIFSPAANGEVSGHWYGYVSPDDVHLLVERHIQKGEVIAQLWRGQMGLSKEEQRKAQRNRLHLDARVNEDNSNRSIKGMVANPSSESIIEAEGRPESNELGYNHKSRSKSSAILKLCGIQNFFDRPQDTYIALAVLASITSVCMAYSCYGHSR